MSEPIPDPGSDFEEEGIPDHEGPLPEKVETGDPQEGMTPPADQPAHAYDHGVTIDEQREGATLNTRLGEEEPEQEPNLDPDESTSDPYPANREEHGGRVVAPDEGGPMDTEKDSVGYDAGPDRGGYSNEERGMHIDPESETEGRVDEET